MVEIEGDPVLQSGCVNVCAMLSVVVDELDALEASLKSQYTLAHVETFRKHYAMGYILGMGINKPDALKSIESELEAKRRQTEELRRRWDEINAQISGVAREIKALEDLKWAAARGQIPADIRPRD